MYSNGVCTASVFQMCSSTSVHLHRQLGCGLALFCHHLSFSCHFLGLFWLWHQALMVLSSVSLPFFFHPRNSFLLRWRFPLSHRTLLFTYKALNFPDAGKCPEVNEFWTIWPCMKKRKSLTPIATDTIQNSNPVGLGHQPHLLLVLKDTETGHFFYWIAHWFFAECL